MEIFTLNVGQGQFVVVTGKSEAIIVDSFVPLSSQQSTEFVKGALANILQGKNLIGLIVTGFDADHFNEVGMKLILNKYNPTWIMYPQYFKNSDTADSCFKVITGKQGLTRYPINLGTNPNRKWNLGNEFELEAFSPHSEDMTSSNNCSLVGKLTFKANKMSYLITGDTENDRWENILKFFKDGLPSHVMAAPHHGSKNGISKAVIEAVKADTVIISAGVGNQFGHPHAEAMSFYRGGSKQVYSTNGGKDGQSLKTYWDGFKFVTVVY